MQSKQSLPAHEGAKNLTCVTFLLVSLFLLTFGVVLRHDAADIASHDFRNWPDESTNSVVSANLSRRLFPAMLRLNSLVDKAYESYYPIPDDKNYQAYKPQVIRSWLYNAYWQHIPPLFAYVPVPFFIAEGKPTIETKRLSYAWVNFITGCIFIIGVAFFSRQFLPAAAAAIAAIFWIQAPYTRSLVTGENYGTSDIVLACTLTCCFIAMLNYLYDVISGYEVSIRRLILFGVLFSLPLLVKHVLGAIPAATFFAVFCFTEFRARPSARIFCFRLVSCLGPFLLMLILYYGSLCWSSPDTFGAEFTVAFKHLYNYEESGRPWHRYTSYYLPIRYHISIGVLVLVAIVIFNLILERKNIEKKQAILLFLPAGWFFANLIAVSSVTSKPPNAIFQSYLFFIFSALYSFAFSITLILSQKSPGFNPAISASGRESRTLCRGAPLVFKGLKFPENRRIRTLIVGMSVCIAVIGARELYLSHKKIIRLKKSPVISTPQQRSYAFAQCARGIGWGVEDLILLKTGYDDPNICYYFLFHTGSEARTYERFRAIAQTQDKAFFVRHLREKYRRIILIVNDETLAALHLSARLQEALECSRFLPGTKVIYLQPDEYGILF